MILVFGHSGQVATELQRMPDVTALGRAKADLTDPAACAQQITALRPRAVINAAAYTAVDRAEDEEPLATRINGDAPGAMARTCADLKIPFLHISTDYVFDGQGTDPWQTDSATAPINAYGRSKLAGEEAVRAAGGAHAILRTSWVFSAHGSNFVKTMLRLATQHSSLRVVQDQIGGPTPAADIAAALAQMAQAMIDGQGGGTFHFSGSPDTSWECFARETFAQAGCDVAVTGIPTTAYPTPATRPLNSRLDCTALETAFGISRPDWTRGLAHVLKELGAT